MRRIILLLLQIALTGPLFSQSNDPVLQRLDIEDAFIHNHLSQSSREVSISTPEALDEAIKTLLNAWALEPPASGPHVHSLGSSTYFVFVTGLFAYNPPHWALCHTWRAYMIDPWLREFEYFRKDPTAEKAGLVRGDALALAATCPMPDPVTWRHLSTAYAEMPEIIDDYLAAEAYARPDIRDRLVALKSELAGMQDVWVIRTLVSEKEPEKAFERLTVAIRDSTHIPAIAGMYGGKALMEYYVQQGNVEQGSRVLNLVSPLLMDAGLPPDTLKAWYARIGRVYDERSLRTAGRVRSLFVKGEVTMPRTGTLLNVTTDEPFDLASLDGKVVMLDFWATWCGPCIAELPDLQRFARDFGTREDFVFISVSSDGATGGASPEEVRSFLQERGIEYIVLYDDPSVALADHFGVRGYPSKFLIGPDGRQLTRTRSLDGQVSLGMVRAYLAEE